MKRGLKQGQMKLSFGMIFSIILIMVFLGFTIYSINIFLDLGKSIQVGTFINNLQTDVDEMWRGSQGSQEQTYGIPSEADAVCFTDYTSSKRGSKQDVYNELEQAFFEFENLFFFPVGSAQGGLDGTKIEHIDIAKITETDNPYCIPSIDGKITMTIKINPGDRLVTIV